MYGHHWNPTHSKNCKNRSIKRGRPLACPHLNTSKKIICTTIWLDIRATDGITNTATHRLLPTTTPTQRKRVTRLITSSHTTNTNTKNLEEGEDKEEADRATDGITNTATHRLLPTTTPTQRKRVTRLITSSHTTNTSTKNLEEGEDKEEADAGRGRTF